MKRLPIIIALMLTLSLYGCGKQEAAVSKVSTDTVAESDSSDIMNEQTQEQASSDMQAQDDDSKETENAEPDNSTETESADENTDGNAENADNEATDNETAGLEAAVNDETEEQSVSEYTVAAYDEVQVMYVIDSVNVRKGPSTDFERIGELKRGQEITVTGQADTSWYEIQYGEDKAYVSNKYLQKDQYVISDLMLDSPPQISITDEQAKALLEAQKAVEEAQKAAEDQKAAEEAQKAATEAANLQAALNAQAAAQQQAAPEVQPVTEVKNVAGVILVGDSRFVQMQESVGPNYCTWIAEGGKGYTWFEEKAIPRIEGCVGSGSKILINLGVNDTRNLQKYITLVNAKAAQWTALGATVYYASVNPVWENPYVTEEQVIYFNTQMQNGLGPYVHWIDSHSYLTSVGYRLVDGLHYSPETYQVIYAYFMSCM